MILGPAFPHLTRILPRLVRAHEPFSCAECAHTTWCDQPPEGVCEERLLRLDAAAQERVCASAARGHRVGA